MSATHETSVKPSRAYWLPSGKASLGFGLVMLLALAIWQQERALFLGAFAALMAGLAGLLVANLGKWGAALRLRSELKAIKRALHDDMVPCAITDSSGCLAWSNACFEELVCRAVERGSGLSNALRERIPNATAVLTRLSDQCRQRGKISDTIVANGASVCLHARQIGSFQVWRITTQNHEPDHGIEEVPMLTTGRNGTILFMNAAARELIGTRVTSLDRLYSSKPAGVSGARNIMTAHGPLLVSNEVQKLQGERSHVFLRPLPCSEIHGGFALADLPVPLLRVSRNGAVEDANDAALLLLGLTDCKGISVSDIFDAIDSQLENWLTKAALTQTMADAEFLRVKHAKKETFVQVSLKRIGPDDDCELLAILTDATKLKSLEAQFVQSQKMQAIGQLAGGVAHDFNNLLTAISGHCDLLLLRHDPGDIDFADLMQIHQNANRAASLVSQLLAFSRKQTLQPETLDLRDTLSDLTHLLNRLVGETVTLSLSHDPVLKAVRADKRQLEQVIMNLVVNARDAMPEGGQITVETESMSLTAPLKRERVTVPAGDYVVVRVRDEGTGIEPAALQKIFEPFYTTKRTGEGTGLGLSTAYGIVKQTGGYIFADSEPGQGTCFSLLFPACEPRKQDGTSEEVRRPALSGGRCDGIVLLVEDEAPVRAFAARALRMRGFEVLEAASAEQALDLLSDEDVKVDIFVTDVVMPGLDGPTWVRQALKSRPDVKVVFVSGYAEGAFNGQTPEVPNSIFLPKPFSLTDLTSTVQQSLN